MRYFRKLYAKLLRSTKEGRSDHKLLTAAVERLEVLEKEITDRLGLDVNGGRLSGPPKVAESAREGGNPRKEMGLGISRDESEGKLTNKDVMLRRIKEQASDPEARVSSSSSILSGSQDTHNTSVSRSHTQPPSDVGLPIVSC